MQGGIVIFGHGYVSSHLARALAAQGLHVHVSTRDPKKFNTISSLGATPFLFGDPLPDLPTHILDTIPPVNGLPPVLEAYKNFPSTIRWAGYLSTTGVYGAQSGDKITETSPTDATHPRASARLTSEAAWAATGLPLHIFRLAGIYGPHRNMLQRIIENDFTGLPNDGLPVHRIHVEDIVQTLMASMATPTPGEVFNLCDDDPAPTYDVLCHAADLLSRAHPQIPEGTSGRMTADHPRHISNTKLKKELGVTLRHPTYREGLATLVKQL